MGSADHTTRLATPDDADEVARLLHDFNREFDVASPGVDVLAPRLRALLDTDATVAIVAGAPGAPGSPGAPGAPRAPGAPGSPGAPGTPIVGLALVTLRPNVWYEGPVALLDELYVVPARRNEGIGSAIVGHLLSLARERRVGLVEINVDEPDVDAQRFYVRHGFSLADLDSGDRAFYMSRELES